MTRDDASAATAEAVVASETLAAHLDRLRTRLADRFPAQATRAENWSDEQREQLHAFLRMFEQLHDLVSRRLFRGALLLSGEDPASLSARNLYRRLERLGGIVNADEWIDLATTRNLLVHDYPVNSAQQVDRANRAWRDLDTLLEATAHIIGFIRSEGLL